MRNQCRRIAKAIRAIGETGQATQPLTIPPRLCPVPGLSVDHQRLGNPVVTAATLKALSATDPAQFEQLAARFLTPTERHAAYSGQCGLLKMRIDQQAQAAGTRRSLAPDCILARLGYPERSALLA